MIGRETVATALRSLMHNPLRTFLTLLGVIIGVGAVVALISAGNATTATVRQRIEGLGTNLLVITPGQATQGGVSQGLGSAPTLTADDIATLRRLPDVAAVAPVQTARALVVVGSQNYQTTLEGSTADLFDVRNLQLSAGRPFNLVEEQRAANVAVIGATAAENLFGNADPVGRTVWVNGIPFVIIGQLASQGGTTANDDRLIVPLTTLERRFTGTSRPGVIYVSAVTSDRMQQTQMAVRLALRRQHGLAADQQDDFVITNQATLLDTLQGVAQALQSFLAGIAGISLLVGGIGIMNIMLVSVAERTREIGLRKALGATRGAILLQFLVESGLVGLLGGALGILLGWAGAGLYGRVSGLPVSLSVDAVWIACLVALAVGLSFGIYPAVRASRLSPIHALRYE